MVGGDKVLVRNGPTAGSAAIDVRLRLLIIVFYFDVEMLTERGVSLLDPLQL